MTRMIINEIRKLFVQINMDRLKWLSESNVVTTVSSKCNLFKNIKLHHWPLLMCVWFLLSLIITYGISVGKKHTYKIFPYISDTGTYPPESCIFGLLINIGTIMMVFNMYLRYRQIEMIIHTCEIDCTTWNQISIWLAAIGCLGMTIVANFQKMNMRSVHFLGADMVLGGGVLYTIFQAKISYALRELPRKEKSFGVTHKNILVRTVLSCMCAILFFILVGCGYASERNFQGDLIWWTPNDHGYALHVIAAISEWLIIIFISIFIMSYKNEFKVLEFEGISFKIN